MTNSASLVTHVDVKTTRMSDHDLVEIFLPYSQTSTSLLCLKLHLWGLDFNQADFTSISDRIESFDWDNILNTNGVERFPELLKSTLFSICQTIVRKKLPPKEGTAECSSLNR